MPTCTPVSAPEGMWGEETTNNEFVEGRMIVTEQDSIVYDSGEYAENENGERTAGMRIRIRGNTSARSQFPPYRIKLSCKGDPMDFGYAAKAWNLIRPMGAWSRKYYLLDSHVGRTVASEAGMQWQPEYKFTELYINGDYRGIYLLSETVERNDNRVDVSKTGFIAEADAYWWMSDPAYVVRTPGQIKQIAYTFKYPEEEDIDANPETLQAIAAYLNQTEEKIYSSADDLDDWISIKSFAAWHWSHDILGTRDTGGANMYFHKKNLLPDSIRKTKLKMGPLWDFDSSFALSVNQWCHHHERNYAFGSELFKRSDFVRHYKTLCDERMDAVCEQVCAMTDSLEATFGKNLDLAIERHNKRCGETMPLLSEQAEFVNTWMRERTQWMKDNLHLLTDGILTDDDSIGSSKQGHGGVSIYTLDGRCIAGEGRMGETGRREQPGVYIVVMDGKKLKAVNVP